MTPEGATELQWEIHGLTLAGLAWGDPGHRPLLALHGWLDNAASFAMLAPHLPGYYIVALDLTGHGRSDWRSPDATYQVYDDLPQIAALLDILGWQSCDLVGHSRGAIISSLFAAAFPERIQRLVLLDGISPPPLAESEFALQMRNYVIEKKRLMGRKARVYSSIDQAVSVREEQGLGRDAASAIASRNLRATDGGYSWTTDPRLRGASAVKLTEGQVDTVLSALVMPTLLLLAEQGLAATRTEQITALGEQIPGATVETIAGGHHFHMEEGVAKLGERILQFLLGES